LAQFKPARFALVSRAQIQIMINSRGIGKALARAASAGHLPRGDAGSLAHALVPPVGLFYDLNVWEGGLRTCKDAFGPGFMHAIAMKSNSVSWMLRRALSMGYGCECASVGEVVHALALGCPPEKIVFDSPCKTRSDIALALKHGIHMNIDNFEELRRLAELRQDEKFRDSASTIGIRLNPMSGAGTIKALSVSTGSSKFGIISQDEIVEACVAHPWITCIHVHVGSGGMGTDTLVNGVRTAAELAQRVNAQVGRRQLTTLDMGGGLAADYGSEAMPDFVTYAAKLREAIPGLMRDPNGGGPEPIFDRVITEFGQSLNAKAGWLGSRVEYVKPTADGSTQVVVNHIGADMCVRQCYTQDHSRRIEFFDGHSFEPKREGAAVTTNVAGPLCFQGDFVAKDLSAPAMATDDLVVLRDAGANTLSLFSRHCSRFAPRVFGYRLGESGEVEELNELKAVESAESLLGWWGTEMPAPLSQSLAEGH